MKNPSFNLYFLKNCFCISSAIVFNFYRYYVDFNICIFFLNQIIRSIYQMDLYIYPSSVHVYNVFICYSLNK